MKLVPGWTVILTRSWSARLSALSGIVGLLAVATAPGGEIAVLFPMIERVFGLESGTLAGIAALLALAAFIARAVPQPKMTAAVEKAKGRG